MKKITRVCAIREPAAMQDRLDNAILGLTFGSVGPLAFFAPKGMWLPILLILLFRFKLLASIFPREYAAIWRRNALFLLLPAYALVSGLWAIVPSSAVSTGAKLLAYVMATCLVVVVIDRMNDGEKRKIAATAAAGLTIASVCVWADLATSGAVSDLFRDGRFDAVVYSRGAAIAACALLPLAVGLYRWRGTWQAVVFTAIVCATVFLLKNEASKVAILLGMAVVAAVRWRGALFWPVLLVPLFVGTIFPVFFVGQLSSGTLCTWYNIKPSAAHRLIVYEFAARKALSKPVLGWGMDGSRSIPGGRENIVLENCRYQGSTSTTQQVGGALPLHPHNASLQVWLELGAAGVVITLGLLVVLIARVRKRLVSPLERAMFAGLFTTILVIYNIGFGLWQSWLIFALIMIVATLRSLLSDRSDPDLGSGASCPGPQQAG